MPLNNPISNSDLIQQLQSQILAVNASPKGVFATVVALEADATANTADGKKNIYIVEADGKWYYWNGSSWAAGAIYQSNELASLITIEDELWEVA